jgi:hypothetical protein
VRETEVARTKVVTTVVVTVVMTVVMTVVLMVAVIVAVSSMMLIFGGCYRKKIHLKPWGRSM